MELADPRAIQQLLDAHQGLEQAAGRRTRPRLPKATTVDFQYQGSSKQRSRCSCQQCVSCKENARWERIFNEKFADPDYYSGLDIRQGSSLQSE